MWSLVKGFFVDGPLQPHVQQLCPFGGDWMFSPRVYVYALKLVVYV